jgi:hypothetical protein
MPEIFGESTAPEVSQRFLNAIWDNLQHYLDDADIRALDESHRAMQDNELRKLIQLVREDAPAAQLRGVSFLTAT